MGASCTRRRGFLAVAEREDDANFNVLDVEFFALALELRDIFVDLGRSICGLKR